MEVSKLVLRRDVHACVTGDWLVLLDLNGDRYWALPRTHSLEEMQSAIEAKGLGPEAVYIGAEVKAWTLDRELPDGLLMARVGWWAHHIVRTGALARAFAQLRISKASRDETSPRLRLTQCKARFESWRLWCPEPFVCLFDALALTRFCLARGHEAEIVFGVRAMPFAAHCWVEVAGQTYDAGEEDCASFTEIARV